MEGWKVWDSLGAFAWGSWISEGLGHALKRFAEQGSFLEAEPKREPKKLCCSQRCATVME